MPSDHAWRFDASEMEEVRKVLEDGRLSARFGDVAWKLEQEFAAKIGTRYAIAANSGTAPLHMAMAAAEVGPGDEVIVPPLTVIATAAAVIHHNGIPVFADIDQDSFNIDPADIERKITDRTRAVIVVSIFGLVCDMDPIMELARRHNLVVVEDCAQTYLSEYRGRCAGSIGHIGSFSFEQTKHMTTGDGGMAVTSDGDLALRMRRLGDHGTAFLEPDDGRRGDGARGHEVIGWNYRMPEVSAAIGLAQLRKLDGIVAGCRRVASFYHDVLSRCDWIAPQRVPPHATHSYYAYVTRFVAERAPVSRDEFKKILAEAGVVAGWGAWKHLVHEEPAMLKATMYGDGRRGCPVRCPHAARVVTYGAGTCPTAERIHDDLLHFATIVPDAEKEQANAERLAAAIARAEKR